MSSHLAPDLQNFITSVENMRGSFFSADNPIFINRCPGRLDLMGGNDDYTGGLVFETTIKEATFFAAQKRDDALFCINNPSVRSLNWDDQITFSLSEIKTDGGLRVIDEIIKFVNADPKRSWITYIVGGLCYLIQHCPEKITHGLNMTLDSNIPLGKGVSSSAALETSALKAAAAVFGIEIKGVDLAMATQWIECVISGAAAGLMDQFAVVMGDTGTFTPMICQPCIPLPTVKLPKGIKIWAIDSGVRHAVSGIEYEAARSAMFMAYQLICEWEGLPVHEEPQGPLMRFTDPKWDGYLARISPTQFRTQYEQRLPITLKGADFSKDHAVHFDPYTRVLDDVEYPVRLAARYAVEENFRVTLFYNILKGMENYPDARSLSLLGELMFGAHQGYTDCNLGCKETDLLVEMVKCEKEHGLYGAKITGGGAGGTVAILGIDTPQAQAAVERIFDVYQEKTSQSAWLFEGSSQGADAFGIYEQK